MVLLMNPADGFRSLLYRHVEHLAMEIFNLQRIGYLCIMHFSILAREDTMVVDVIQ